ncbi:MAG: M48 family metalloprotease [Gammaproteobacteria bacterium]|nr:M48 family metalloprotease [Gammaproteobacteria bacterium]
MVLLAATLTIGLSAAAGLAYTRWASRGGEAPGAFAAVTAVGASLGISFAVLGLVWALVKWMAPPPGWFEPTYAGMAAAGALMGATIFLTVRVILAELAPTLLRWSLRTANDNERTWREALTTTCLGLLGMTATMTLVFVIGHAVSPYGLALWLFPFFVALFPLYETFLLPWVQYARAPTLKTARLSELQDWICDLRARRNIPKFRIRVQNGRFENAFAIGGLGTHLIVVGKGLVDGMSPAHLRAVVAHEIAHVARRDVPRLLLPLVVVGGTLHAISVVKVSHPLFATHEVWGIASGTILAGLFAGVFMMLLPGFFMRRMEFGADRLAAEMLGDGELLAQALERLSEITGQRLDEWSWSHPPLQARIEALRLSPA